MIRLGICNELFEGWDFRRVCRTVKDLGYDGLEIAPFTLAPRITDLPAWRLAELRSMIDDAGLETIGLHWLLAKTEGFHLTSPDPEVRRRTAHYLVSLAEATQALGGKVMVFGSPKQRDLLPGVDYRPDTLRRAVADANDGSVATDDGNVATRWLLCFHYDPAVGIHAASAIAAVRGAALAALLALVGVASWGRVRARGVRKETPP